MTVEPGGDQKPAIRVGDQDREAVVQRLQQAFAEGRLDDEEFDQRTRAALTAKHSSDLAGLTRDLPDTATAPVPGLLASSEGRRRDGGSAIAYKS